MQKVKVVSHCFLFAMIFFLPLFFLLRLGWHDSSLFQQRDRKRGGREKTSKGDKGKQELFLSYINISISWGREREREKKDIIINITVGFCSSRCNIQIQYVLLEGIQFCFFVMKSTSPIRIHLNIPEENFERPSLDFDLITPLPTAVTLTKNRLTTQLQHVPYSHLDPGRRSAVRFSNVSSSYAQFLKQRDMDKAKKTVSRLFQRTSPIRVHRTLQKEN